MLLPPFETVEPSSAEVPVIVEVPHAGLWIDPLTMGCTLAPVRSVARDADLYVDELVADCTDAGATLLVARASRYVVDLNRESTQYDALAVRGGPGIDCPRGVIWRLTAGDEPLLAAPLQQTELRRRLNTVYQPYHDTLDALVCRKMSRFGGVVVLSQHSMPSQGRSLNTGEPIDRSDVVIGTRSHSTAAGSLISLVDEYVRSFGWTVAHDDPYRGGATTARLGRPTEGIHAIQLELARRLYMNETTLDRRERDFGLVKSFCRGLVAKIGAIAVG